MHIDTNLSGQAEAFRLAWRLRHCPPDHMLLDAQDPRVALHLEVCEECADLADYLRSQADGQSPMLQPEPAEPAVVPEPKPGEIWSLRPDHAGWINDRELSFDRENYRYATPPQVLVLSTAKEMPDAIAVAQLGPFSELSGPGDVFLSETSPEFVESWNTYTLDRALFSRCLGSVSTHVLEQVRLHAELEPFEPTPDSHMSSPALEQVSLHTCLASPEPSPGSRVALFRQMETSIGAYFSLPCVVALLERLEQEETAPELVHELNWQSVFEKVRQRFSERLKPIHDTIDDALAGLAGLRFRSEYAPATCTKPGIPVNINRLILIPDAPDFRPEVFTVTAWERTKHGLEVTGELCGKAAVGRYSTVQAFWVGTEKQYIPATRCTYSDGIHVSIEFSGPADDFPAETIEGMSSLHLLVVEMTR